MGVGCNLQIPLTPDGTTSRSIKDYHRPFWPEVLLFPATVNTDERHDKTKTNIHQTQKHTPAATKWTHRRMRILNDICFGLWAVRANHNETVRHYAYGLTEWAISLGLYSTVLDWSVLRAAPDSGWIIGQMTMSPAWVGQAADELLKQNVRQRYTLQ